MNSVYYDYFLEQLEKVLNIPSISGDYEKIQEYIREEVSKYNYKFISFNKGGCLVELGGESNPIVINAHADTLGLMVKNINNDGTIQITNIGRLPEYAVENANIKIKTYKNKVYTGTIRRKWSCIHVTPLELRNEAASYTGNLCLQLDEDVNCYQDVINLGIGCGDIINIDNKFQVTNSGHIKSYFLDNKVNIALVITLMKYYYEQLKDKIERKVYIHISMHEEVMHGGACGIPDDAAEILSLDVSCVCENQNSNEHAVSICMADSRFPYNRDMIKQLINVAERKNINYRRDIFIPTYGTDADIALLAGYDLKHALIGPGVVGTHSYERTHYEGIKNTFDLLIGYLEN
ncbi:MAG: peptidase M42 [Oscillospiraceae bacterium]|nr:peptidase M42 [Oscillospiraceae bacterium]